MRITKMFNDNWQFSKNGVDYEAITLPHTWNGVGGQDGAHAGGYATFRVNLTEALRDENELLVHVDNGKNRTVYPQKADFTFYGGLYRDVRLIMVPKNHFALDYFGAPGIKVTPVLSEDGSRAEIGPEAWCVGDASTVEFSVTGLGAETIEAAVTGGYARGTIVLEQPHLWNGMDDSYLYCARAALGNDDAGKCKAYGKRWGGSRPPCIYIFCIYTRGELYGIDK